MRVRTTLAAILLSSCASAPRSAPPSAGPPEVAPEAVGFSAERLERLDSTAERLMAEGVIAGAVVLLVRHGRIAHFEAYGHMDVASGRPMRRDALFRICSMSKAVTSVAAMILYEEGRFLPDDPVAEFLPEFAEPRVLVDAPAQDGAPYATEPAEHPITIRHLLTHTSGITYRFLGEPVIADLYAEAGIADGLAETELDLAENVRRIASQPLLHQPGERFSYGLSTDVLGRLVEVVSGRPLGEFLEERIFEPLGMVDTGFFVAGEDLVRLPTVYRTARGSAPEALADGPHEEGHLVFSPSYPYLGPRRYESGGAGLVTTAMDFARFCRMLDSGGELDGVRLLGRKTVEMMTADHLSSLDSPPGFAFGLGLALASDPGSGAIPSEGTWSWDGFYTTRFWIDPREDLIGVVLTQTYYNSGRALDRLVAAAYQAIDD